MAEKSVAEFTTISKENIAAMLALIGKEEQNTSSPTAIVMLSNLKTQMKIIFDKMVNFGNDYATLRIGNAYQLDDYWFEYAQIPKKDVKTKLQAMNSVLNSIVQAHQVSAIKIVAEDQTSDAYEFIVQIGNDPFI